MNIDQLASAKFDCEYWDARVETVAKTDISYRNEELMSCDVKPSQGCFLRVYVKGRWFYASTTALEKLEESLEELCRAASLTAGSGVSKDLFSGIMPLKKELTQFSSVDVRSIPLMRKRKLCESYFGPFKAEPLIKDSRIIYSDYYKVRQFSSSKGVQTKYDLNLAGLYFLYTLKDGNRMFDDAIRESFPRFEDLENLEGLVKGCIAESRRFLDAKTVVAGTYRVLMDTRSVGTFAHESFGHKSESDFMLGDENALKEWALGSKIGTDAVTIVDDGGIVGTSGYCPFDDEGSPAQKTVLIEKGVLKGRLHSLNTAQALGEKPTGNARSINFEFEPIVRMTSTYMEPGEFSFEELVEKTGEGIFIKDAKHGSGDSRFTIAPRKSYWIREGKLAEPVLVTVITGSVFETLGRVEACGKDFKLHSSVLGGCGKNDQMPLSVALGGPPMLVSAMEVS